MRTFVALGDSFTEGLSDDLGPDGRHLGWADRVAAGLAKSEGGLRYANLAVRGRVLDQVVDGQLPVGLALRPDLVSFHGGGNDALRPSVRLEVLMPRYETAVKQLRDSGAEVLLFTVVERAGGTGRTAQRLAERFAAFNREVRRVAATHGCLLFDQARVVALQDRRMWHEDRLHLLAEGHARVAAGVLEVLGVNDPAVLGGAPGWWEEPMPAGARASRRGELVADVRWVRRHLAPWVWRRVRRVSSGDAVDAKHLELIDVIPS